jgi:hypothetical protein
MAGVSAVRVAVALLLATAGGVAVLLAATAGAAPNKHFQYTHRFTFTGQFVDHWTFNDPSECGLVGDGTVTVKFRTTKAPKVRLVVDPGHNGEPNNTLGSWILGVPTGGGIGDIRAQPAAGTVTLVDNTSPRPPASGGECVPPDKSDCRTTPLPGGAQAKLGGYNRRQLYADLYGGWELKSNGRLVACRVGEVTTFSAGRLTGGSRAGELLLKMPTQATVARSRAFHVTATSHKHTTFLDCGSGTTCSDDVTRRVTVTFTRL